MAIQAAFFRTKLTAPILASTKTYPEHGSEVRVSEPEGDVRDVKTLRGFQLLRRVLVDVVMVHDRRRHDDAAGRRHGRHVRWLTHVL